MESSQTVPAFNDFWFRHREPKHGVFRNLPLLLAPALIFGTESPVKAKAISDEQTICAYMNQALDRIIQQVRQSILKEEVNIFDLRSVNMFQEHSITQGFPLQSKLLASTYKSYQQVQHQLSCFTYRTCIFEEHPLSQDLTPDQFHALKRVYKIIQDLTEFEAKHSSDDSRWTLTHGQKRTNFI